MSVVGSVKDAGSLGSAFAWGGAAGKDANPSARFTSLSKRRTRERWRMEAGGSRAALKRARKKQSETRPPPPERRDPQPTAASSDQVVGKKRDKRKDKRAAKRKLQEVEQVAGDEPDELEGVVVDGELLLRDPSSGAVYASERDERGALVAVGRWEAGKVVPLAVVAAPSDAAAPAPAPSVPHPLPQPLAFAAAEDDHCETAPEAYTHIAGALQQLAATLGVAAAELRIYDPFYCNGAVERHLAALGFPCVHNRNEDFYAVLQEGRVPPHDVVVSRRLSMLILLAMRADVVVTAPCYTAQ